ncbi:L,D-transpeptidase [Massilia sp. B-10]|nr:L,D-transpeptidase [Massilia sp. B-10]
MPRPTWLSPVYTIPEEMADKARLPALGYASAAEALGEKFHASAALLQRLNPGKDLARGRTDRGAQCAGHRAAAQGRKIVVDKSERTLTLLDTACKQTGRPVSFFVRHRQGSAADRQLESQWHIEESRLPLQPQAVLGRQPGRAKATIPVSPNNPVGVAWIDLSKPHYGIHGTPIPGTIGKTQSHGCIRLTNWDVMAVTESVGPGTDVLMQE